ncbi:DUF4232 domain-containing protein [Streptomyces griseus]|uniref:DUF4232 domain-containing protein n=1 Tax=Streptomyces griseus TaxID=1911 RepID=UPI00055BA7CD|nr:DUF4232 domain-containing protein [Streptomyces griseus]
MRAVPLTVTALAAALLLTACDSGGDASGGGADSGSSAEGKSPGGACAIGKLGSEVGPVNAAPAAGDSGNVTVTLTNQGPECALEGFPAISLDAGSVSGNVPHDEAAQPQKLTLAENATATFTITYARGAGGDAKSLSVKTVKYGLPGAKATKSFPWSYGDIALKGDTGEPDASVSAFQQAGD